MTRPKPRDRIPGNTAWRSNRGDFTKNSSWSRYACQVWSSIASIGWCPVAFTTKHIHRSEPLLHLADKPLHLDLVPHIGPERLRSKPAPLKLATNLLGPLPVREVVHCNVEPRFRKSNSHRGSKPARSSGNQCNPTHTLEHTESSADCR